MKRLIIAATILLSACSASSEAPRTSKPVFASDNLPASFTNDEGWLIEITSADVAMTGISFTTNGEAHVAQLMRRIGDALVPPAWAHPGHLAGGEVIGELAGDHLVEMGSGARLGDATLIVGRYDGANFTFMQRGELDGASIALAGTAVRDDVEVSWSATIAQDVDRAVVGLPMDVEVNEGESSGLAVELLGVSPTNDDDTMFDGIDFGGSPELEIRPDSADGARLLRASQRHDFWRVIATE